MKSNFEQLEVKCEDLQQQLQAEKTEKLIFQQQHDQIVNEWRSQLDSKALEFDRLREQLQQPQYVSIATDVTLPMCKGCGNVQV